MKNQLPVPRGISQDTFARTARERRDERELKWLSANIDLLGARYCDRATRRATRSFYGSVPCERALRICRALDSLRPEQQSLLLDAYAPPTTITVWAGLVVADTGLAFQWSRAFGEALDRRGACLSLDPVRGEIDRRSFALLAEVLAEILPAIRVEIAEALRLFSVAIQRGTRSVQRAHHAA